MVLDGYAYHHAEVPQAVRNCLERAYRDGTYRIRGVDAKARHVTNFAQASGIDAKGNIFVSRHVTATIPVEKRHPKPHHKRHPKRVPVTG